MKQKILLLFAVTAFIASVNAQKKVTAYAITGSQKGGTNWTEVRLVDITTGDELKTIYQSTQEAQILNARTGKEISKKDVAANTQTANNVKREVNNDLESSRLPVRNSAINLNDASNVNSTNTNQNRKIVTVRSANNFSKASMNKPFSTNSAACAYDKKHERLYYTPMGINQLRYIELKSGGSKIFYFEDEPFGALTSRSDVANQITRMVIGSDGNGYALTNNGNHLIQFTTNKKAVVTDLGPLTDDASNGSISIHSQSGYGGDMIADKSGNFYVVTANRLVFKVNSETKVATYKGSIQGMAKGYSTNGAVVEVDGENKMIVSSSNSTSGYYRIDLNTLQAEKIGNNGSVFNASDLANGNLIGTKKKKEKHEEKQQDVLPQADLVQTGKTPTILEELVGRNAITAYPNPVTNGYVKLSFENQPAGKYQIQFMDITGKIISAKEVTINNRIQVEEFRLPQLVAAGNYLIKAVNETNKISIVNKLVVQ